MNTHKLSGRHGVMMENRDASKALGWLTDQPEVRQVIASGVMDHSPQNGKAGKVQVLQVNGSRVFVDVKATKFAQKATLSCASEDAAVLLAIRIAQTYGLPLPEQAKEGATPRPEPDRPRYVPRVAPVPDVDKRPGLLDDAPAVSSDIQTQIRLVSPEVAARWLEGTVRQRTLSDDVVERYAADMKAGRWTISESAICFDTNGQLLNGQHRLWAVLNSGCTIKALVSTGYPPDAIMTMDDGYARKPAQVYKIATGETASTLGIAVARLLTSQIHYAGQTKNRMPRSEMFEVYDRYKDGIKFAEEVLGGTRGISITPVACAMARAYYARPDHRDRMRLFGDRLVKGIVTEPGETGASALRGFLMMGGAQSRSSTAQAEAYAKAERAIDAFLHATPITRLYASKDELFPLDEESGRL
jgi:hypothetical protein